MGLQGEAVPSSPGPTALMPGLGKTPGASTIASWLPRTECKAPEETGLSTVPVSSKLVLRPWPQRLCRDSFILPQTQIFWEKLADKGKVEKESSEATSVPGSHQKPSGRASLPQAYMEEAER